MTIDPNMPSKHDRCDSDGRMSKAVNHLSNGFTDGFAKVLPNISIADREGHNPKSGTLEPIAVIGMAMKFPQGATSPEAFWQMLMKRESAMSDVPKERFNIDAFYQSGSKKTHGLNTRGGHFIQEDLAGFDGPFFSMAPAEIACMDPQQRWLLEVAYEALESAGIPMEKAVRSRTSVHIGCSSCDYQNLLARDHQVQAKHKMTGTALSMLANRISWFYNFTGPSIAMDTACSSSLTALHTACQSIHSGDATMGLIGGCNLYFDPDNMMGLADLDFLSPDSKCYSFDSRANGYARGEGFGIIVVKALSKALEDGDTIRAIIRATGVNQDGRTPGITQPNSKAQESLIRETYAAAGLDMASTRYFEAHGTGTSLGDPLEASAINASFGNQRSRDEPLYIGATKSNIGHLEGASGIAGVIKTILVLEKGIIPPNIWFEKPNPRIPQNRWNIKFPLEPLSWPTDGLRRASVNSFGFGGTNAHVILEDAYNFLRLHSLHGRHRTELKPPRIPVLSNAPSETYSTPSTVDLGGMVLASRPIQPMLFLWSASEESGLQRLAIKYKEYFQKLPKDENEYKYLIDLAYTLSEKRSRLPWKSFAVVNSRNQLQESLESELSKPIRSTSVPKLGFVFTGQGAQWHAMARELFYYKAFRESLEKAEAYFQHLGSSWLLIQELFKDQDASRLSNPDLSQPICTALQIALVELLLDWGVVPSAVVGHSSGEIAAAYCIGAISREAAWKIAYYRGVVALSLIQSNKEPGAMMSVGLSEADIEAYLCQAGSEVGNISVACINSPRNVTLSGSQKQIALLEKRLEKRNVFARKLKVTVAYHSPSMDEVAFTYGILIHNIEPGEPAIGLPAMFSSVTGHVVSHEELTDSGYWVKNMTCPVKFMQAVTQICSNPSKKLDRKTKSNNRSIRVDHLLEIGPHSTLQGPIRDILNSSIKDSKICYNSMLIRGKSALHTALSAAGSLICAGYPVRLVKINDPSTGLPEPCMLTNLPAYPFNHTKKYWIESRLSKNFRFRKFPHHELLGTQASDWSSLEARWRNIITLEDSPWISDHKVNGTNIYPAAGMLVMAIEAACQLADSTRIISGYQFKDVSFHKAIVIPSTEAVEVQFYLRPNRQKSGDFLTFSEFRLCIYEKEEWLDVCEGSLAVEYVHNEPKAMHETDVENANLKHCKDYENGAARCKETMATAAFYKNLDLAGITYGHSFQSVKGIRYNGDGEATALIDLLEWMSKTSGNKIQSHVIHPAALDAIFQLGFAGLSGGEGSATAMMPTKIRALWISGLEDSTSRCGDIQPNRATVKAYTKTEMLGFRNALFSMVALNVHNGSPCLVGDLEATRISEFERPAGVDCGYKRLCYNIKWKLDLDLLDNEQISSYCSKSNLAPSSVSISVDEENKLACLLSLMRTDGDTHRQAIPCGKPHLLKYSDWMKDQISAYSTAKYPGSLARLEDLKNNPDYLNELYDKVEKSSVDGQALVRVARNLSGILKGDVDALELLFSDELMESFYQSSSGTDMAFKQLDRYLDAYAHKNPNMKVLEIGAGTGGATTRILHTLTYQGRDMKEAPRFAEYTFTDISSSFFDSAKSKFDTHSDRMVFSTLNIEKNPADQGFEEGKYDLVVASNVLHATTSVANALKNTRKLLKADGKLILYESIDPAGLMPGFIFGLLPGWWLASENDGKMGPLLTENIWHEKLSNCNFSGVDVALPGFTGENYHTSSVMISTASKNTEGQLTVQNPVIIVTMSSPLQLMIAEQLKSRLDDLSCPSCKIISVSEICSTIFNQTICIFLPELEHAFLHRMDQKAYAGLKTIVSCGQGLLWLTNSHLQCEANPANSMAVGLSRCLYGERPDFKMITLSIEGIEDPTHVVQNIMGVFLNTIGKFTEECELEYVEKDGNLSISRVIEAEYLNHYVASKTTSQSPKPQKFCSNSQRPVKLAVVSPGLLDTLCFVDDTLAGTPVSRDEIEIKIKASGLNFRDVLIALGQDNADYIGMECAGFVTQAGEDTSFHIGDRVACIAKGSFAAYTRCKAIAAVSIPEDMTFVSAAAILVSYCTAYYALIDRAQMKSGESVLIHSGAGGLGQACIQLSKLLKAEIYVTVGSDDKRNLLMDLHNIPEDHIFSSRTPGFASSIQSMTNSRGVDVIVNSLAGEAMKTSWGCIAPFGRFLETGKKDIFTFGKLPMFPFSKNAAFFGIDLFQMYGSAQHKIGELIQEIMSLLKAKSITPPFPLEVFQTSQIEDAFRYMQSGRNKGKIVIEFNDDDIVPVVPSILPTYEFDENATYLIAGGLGGLGRSIARWMASRNTKNLILLSRSGIKDEAGQLLLDELGSKGVNVMVPACDVSNMNLLASVLAECNKRMPPVKGCIQASMVLKDAIFDNMTLEQFDDVVRPKVDGSWNLHTLLPQGMDFFIFLSSLSGVAGLYGQSNYACGNTYQDALAQYRVAQGEKAVSLDLGKMLSVGYVAEREGLTEALQGQFFMGVHESEFHAILDYYCDPKLPLTSSLHSQAIVGLELPATLKRNGLDEPFWMRRTMFTPLYQIQGESDSTAPNPDADLDYGALIRGADCLADVSDLIVDGLRTKLSRSLAMEKENIDITRPMHTYGVDSLAAVEVRTWFRRVIQADVTVFEILGNQNIASFGASVAGKSGWVKAELRNELEKLEL